MARCANADTLFHLVPLNQVACNALNHPDNSRFVSRSDDGEPGLEVGFHVPAIPHGRTITRLGKLGDLILSTSTPEKVMSRIHASFDFHPGTHLILLAALSKSAPESSVQFQPTDGDNRQPVPTAGDGVIAYNTEYTIWIASYEFKLVWRTLSRDNQENHALLKELARRGYQLRGERLARARSLDVLTAESKVESRSWHNTRFNTAKNRKPFEDVKSLRTPLPGASKSTYGTIFMAFDSRTANAFVIKKIQLEGDEDEKDAHRALCHREVKLLEKLNHPNIIECIGCNDFESDAPEILLPLREGTASSLAGELTDFASKNAVCTAMTGQMLAALDYLDSEKVVRRDIKPANILYMSLPGNHQYQFQLADFGLSHHQPLAKTLEAGTPAYIAPELVPHWSGIQAPQSSKSDIWSLGATILAFLGIYPPKANVPRNNAARVRFFQQTVVDKAKPYELLVAVAQMHPEQRASAAQLLVKFFGGRGLVSNPSQVPPLQSLIPEAQPVAQPNATAVPAPAAAPSPLQQPQASAGDARPRNAIDPLAERGPFGLPRSRLKKARATAQPVTWVRSRDDGPLGPRNFGNRVQKPGPARGSEKNVFGRHLVQLGATRPGAVIGALLNEAGQQAVPTQHAVPTQQAVPPPDVGTAAASLSLSDAPTTLENQNKRMWRVPGAFPES